MRHTERPKSHLDFDRVPDGAAVGRAVDRDANLVAQLRHQEPGAAEALVAVYGDRVYRLAVRITENRWDAEEVAQDALLAVIRNIDSFRGEAAFGTWMYRIAANAAYQKQRSRRHERHETSGRELVLPVDTTSEPAPLDTDWSPRLEDPALHGELRDILRVAIDALREGHRAIFLLHDVYGLSKLEIAAAFEMKVGTVKSRLHRARLFLRSRLATYLNLPETAESKASVGGALSRIDAPDRRDRGGASASGAVLHHVTRADPGPPAQFDTFSLCAPKAKGTSSAPCVLNPTTSARSERPSSPRIWTSSFLYAGSTRRTEVTDMTPPTETVANARRAGASPAGCEGRTCDQTPAPLRLDRDGQLVEALRLAKPTAAEDLVVSYAGRAHRLAIGITKNRLDAEEVVQDALWTVVNKISTFRGDSPFRPWLDRIVANAACDKVRNRRQRLDACSLDELPAVLDEHGEFVVNWSSRAQDPTLATDLRIVLTAAINTLPEAYRIIVVLRDAEGLSTQKIAQLTGLSIASVKTRAHRARLELRKRLAAHLSNPVGFASEYGSYRRSTPPALVVAGQSPGRSPRYRLPCRVRATAAGVVTETRDATS
jgi:RNA polymerase sigma-70 factor (ECF subfamily)